MEQKKLLKLIQQSKEGNSEAQSTLVREVQNRVYYHCLKMMKNEDDAKDATQDILIAMLTSLDKLREPAAFWGWVNGITANRCKHLLTTPHKEWQIPEDDDGNSMLDSIENIDEQLVPDKALDNEETRRMILDLVDNLPPEQRMCVLFYYYDEMSVKEIAQAMGTSDGTVKSRLNYARKAIKSGVEDYERKGVKLYDLSPILLLIYFLHKDAAATTLSDAAASAMAGQVLAHAGVTTAAGSTATAAAGSAATATTAATGAAMAGISTKLIAGILAGVIAIGGATAGIVSIVNHNDTDSDEKATVGESIVETIETHPEWVDIATCDSVTGLIDSDNSLWMCGTWNNNQNLPEEDSDIAVKVMDDVRDIDFGLTNLAAIRTDGSLWVWDDILTPSELTVPLKVADNVVSVSLGNSYVAAIKADGSLWTWDYSSLIQSGDDPSSLASLIMEDVVAVSCGGNHIAAIKTDGSLWTWGDNGRGQLGNGTTENSLIPIKVMDDVVQVSCADSYTAAVKNDGSLWMWGHNAENQLSSLGTQDSFLYPIQIMDNVESVSCGGWCTAAIKHDGTLWMWGSNNRGQLGIGTTDSSFVPVQVLSNVAAVSCNKTYTAVIKTDGSVWGWGHNVYRQLGTGTAESSLIPVQMQFSIENNYIVSWIDPEPAVKPETSDPQESESPEEPETFESDSFPEAYAAYLEEFNEHRSLIDAYTDWYGFRRPIAFVDIYGDSTPEMIYVEAETVTSSDSYLNILTYQNGQVVLLSRKYWDFFAGSGLSYTLYQAEGSKTLYAYTSYFTSTTIYEQICFEEVDGTLSPQNIESMPAQYQIILSNITSAPVAMTCDEAFTFLTEHSSIS